MFESLNWIELRARQGFYFLMVGYRSIIVYSSRKYRMIIHLSRPPQILRYDNIRSEIWTENEN
jgi:hypothetical protein